MANAVATLSFLFLLSGNFGDEVVPKKFDVASVRPCAPTDERIAYRRLPGGGLYTTGMPLDMLIILAYEIPRFPLSGGPAWADNDCWTIQAKVEGVHGQLSRAQQAPMLRALLEDRFELVIRRDRKEMPVFELTVAKGGPRLKPHPSDSTDVRLKALPGIWELNNVDIGDLTERLSRLLKRPVIDKTDLTGRYDIWLHWTRDDDQSSTPGPAANGPSIFTALQEQLGLKLQSTKGLGELLVIEHVEKAKEN
jgi:uncharacterized protein (TIGR03435 family)